VRRRTLALTARRYACQHEEKQTRDMKDMMMMQEGGTKGGAIMKDKPKSHDNLRK